jgi:LPS sulfotransferase NodH/2-polyprenyl-3-methyl-5-hydroxy-6-metoxy-1,4-benzoquinol methylase
MPLAADIAAHGDSFRDRGRPEPEQDSVSQLAFIGQSFDFPGPIALRRSYIVASTPRCGSAFLSTRLWATGVLGAPAEYFGNQKPAATKMITRLAASSPVDYLQRLLECRTTRNGIFGLNIEFRDFENIAQRFPEILRTLSPITYILIDRQDQTVQAALMAKVVQSGTASSKEAAARPLGYKDAHRPGPAAQYNRDLIALWLGRIERQKLGWIRWFDANGIGPFIVRYENLITKPAAVVRSIVELLGVDKDEPQKVSIVLAKRPSDRVSAQWAARFQREIASGIERPESAAGISEVTAGKARHVLDRYLQTKGAETIGARRSRMRYAAITRANGDLFRDARVLDVRCGDGCWSLVALDGGALRVVAMDGNKEALATASHIFAKIDVKSSAYRFINKKIFEGFSSFNPETFDVILCRDVSPDPYFFFGCLKRLRPKHVILDTRISGHKQPALALRLRPRSKSAQKTGAQSSSIAAIPSQPLIHRLCDSFGFKWRVIDWSTLGIADSTSVEDYKRGRRGTYVLDYIS